MMCKAKNGYATKLDALVKASLSLRFQHADTGTLRPYRCPSCRCWHITKKARRGHDGYFAQAFKSALSLAR